MYDLIRNLDVTHNFIKPYEFAKMVSAGMVVIVDGYTDFV
jgi:hypothetical protein